MNWLSILEYAFKTVIIGGVVLLIGAIIKKWTDKSLHEHQIRFSKLHHDRADVIRELYSKLVKMEISLRYYMKRFEFGNEPSDEEKRGFAACLYATPIKSRARREAVSLVGAVVYTGPL